MLPIQFALNLETAINHKITEMKEISQSGSLPAITLLENFQTAFLELLAKASTIDIDSVPYPTVDETRLLAADAAWQTAAQSIVIESELPMLLALWSVTAAVDKALQFYQQAAVNSAHPQTRLFFNSLSHVKKILRRRLDGIIQIYHNHYWGELGFAPFSLGKD